MRTALDGELVPSTIAAATAPAAPMAIRLRNMDIREEWEQPIIVPQISQKEHAVRMLGGRACPATIISARQQRKSRAPQIIADGKTRLSAETLAKWPLLSIARRQQAGAD